MTGIPVDYDEASDTLTIYGIRYSMSLFREMSSGPIGGTFRIVSREDGVVTLQTIEQPRVEAGA